MNTQFNSNVIWLQLEYKISTLGPTRLLDFRIISNLHCYSDSTLIRHHRVSSKFTKAIRFQNRNSNSEKLTPLYVQYKGIIIVYCTCDTDL